MKPSDFVFANGAPAVALVVIKKTDVEVGSVGDKILCVLVELMRLLRLFSTLAEEHVAISTVVNPAT